MPGRNRDGMGELQALVEYIARGLVDDPASVRVQARRRGPNVTIDLRVPAAEMGKVIGRQGRIARAMRTLLTIAAARNGLRASLDIHE
ncbi:MAG: KH domain-containing protein [Sphaerobacter thermophilus]|uniref:KH domain-containing protein n=1 Tax=Sphaerobacter thermophilus TaxID=2057 RepID=UPI002352FC45